MNNKELIQAALAVVKPRTIHNADMGGVGCALVTTNNTIFTGVCIDTISGMGFCAEHSAISQMITQSEYRIEKIVAVKRDEKGNVFILSPCGRCREFMYQTNPANANTKVILDLKKTVLLSTLLPYKDWRPQITL